MQTVAQVARSQKSSFFAGKRTAVHGKNHRQRGLINQQRLQRHGVCQIRDAFSDVDALNARNRHQVARGNGLRFIPFQAAEGIQLGDSRRCQLAVQLADAYLRATLQRTVEYPPDRDASQKLAVIQVHHLDLQNAIGLARGSRNVLYDGLEKRQQIL